MGRGYIIDFAYFLPPSALTIVDQMSRNVKMECRNKSAARFCYPDSNRITSRLVTKTGAGALPLSYAARDRIRLNLVFRKVFAFFAMSIGRCSGIELPSNPRITYRKDFIQAFGAKHRVSATKRIQETTI